MAMTRRSILCAAPSLALTAPALAGARPDPGPKGWRTTLEDELVRRMVSDSHGKMESVRALLTDHPELAKAAIDWGFGDWETALGAASHTGQRDIAMLLMEHGARPDIFTFAMLGLTASVRAMVEAMPGVQRTLGPHGLTLAHHARAGGERAKDTLEYLVSLGDADTSHPSVPLSDEQRAACAGVYKTGDGTFFVLVEERGGLQFKSEGWSPRPLMHQGTRDGLAEFMPRGAPRVRVRVFIENGRAVRAEVRDGSLLVSAART